MSSGFHEKNDNVTRQFQTWSYENKAREQFIRDISHLTNSYFQIDGRIDINNITYKRTA